MSRFQGPGQEGSKWQTEIPQFNNITIGFQMNLKEILEMDMGCIKSMENEPLQRNIEKEILVIYNRCVKKYKYWIKCCFFSTFLCFIGMIGYPFGNLFGLIIPSQDDLELVIIYAILLIVIEIGFIYFYFKCHDTAHNLEHKAICFYIDQLTEWVVNHQEIALNVNLIYPKQILDFKAIDHGKPLNVYICVIPNDESITIENQSEILNATMNIIRSSNNGIALGQDKINNIQTPLLKT